MTVWDTIRRDLRATASVIRYRPGHTLPPDPRAERLAAGWVGLLVLLGATLTYVVAVGGIGPLLGSTPAGGAPAPPGVTRTTTPPGAGAVLPPATAGPSSTPAPTTTRPRPAKTTPTATVAPAVATTPPPTRTPTPTPTADPSPTEDASR